ncbi:uncharacterized protein [Centroberyx affinis]|uniref:uncharacterized protein n=1 Tax=Centroberyx affinis TaxID=166261 RepID=UPI003A5C68EC
MRECPLCGNYFSRLRQHLTQVEKINNEEEKVLLLCWANGRISGKLSCSICDRAAFSRLDKHLTDVHSCAPHEVDELMFGAKQTLCVQKLRELRATNPSVPLMSRLDLLRLNKKEEEEEEEEEAGPAQEDDCVVLEDSESEPFFIVLEDCDEEPGPLGSCPPPPSSSSLVSLSAPQACSTPKSSTSRSLPPPSPSSPSSQQSPQESSTHPSLLPLRTTSVPQPSPSSCSPPSASGQSSITSCQGCISLTARVALLETSLKQLQDTVAMQLFNQRKAGASSSVTTGTTVEQTPTKKGKQTQRTPQLKRSLIGNILLQFQRAALGCRTGRKDKENARNRRNHAQRFCCYMQRGAKRGRGLRFLYNLEKLQKWPTQLKEDNYKVTSIKNILLNVKAFLSHIEVFHKNTSKLTTAQLSQLQHCLKKVQSDIMREVVPYRQTVKRQKSKSLLSANTESKFLTAAKLRIPQLLKQLERKSKWGALELVGGYLLGYLAVLTGHRPVVFACMTKLEVLEADNEGEKYIVWVAEHKTQRSFGHALIPLYKVEHEWLSRLANISDAVCSKTPFLFHRRDGKQLTKPGSLLQMAWNDAGLAGAITFNRIRSSVSSQAKKHLNQDERAKVATAMCHDVGTAEKFYCPVQDLAEAFGVRGLRMKALADSKEDEESSSGEPGQPTSVTNPDPESPPFLEASSSEEEVVPPKRSKRRLFEEDTSEPAGQPEGEGEEDKGEEDNGEVPTLSRDEGVISFVSGMARTPSPQQTPQPTPSIPSSPGSSPRLWIDTSSEAGEPLNLSLSSSEAESAAESAAKKPSPKDKKAKGCRKLVVALERL